MKPNAVVICVDTFRADMGGSGGKLSFVKTPNIDRLRDEGVSFTRCFGEGEPTIPVRRCLFTGRRSFPWRHNIPNEGLQPHGGGWHAIPPEHDALAEILHDNGWLTALVADTYHMFKPTMNFTRGFLSWQFIRGQENDPYRSGPLSGIDLSAHTPEDNPTLQQHPTLAQYLLNAQGRTSEEDWQAAQVFRSAASWLEQNRANSPFFLWIDSFSPHELWDPPRQYADAYFPSKPGLKDYIYPGSFRGNMERLTDDEQERVKALYFGFVTFVDRWIGHLLDAMDSLRLWDDTIVMFVTDHGTEMLDKGRFGKSAARLHPYNTRLNWIVRHPDGPRGVECGAWTQNDDMFPTLLNLLGVSVEECDGYDVWPVVSDPSKGQRKHAVTGWGNNVCVRGERWAVHMNATADNYADTARVYDLENDPDENENVAGANSFIIQQAVKRVEQVAGPMPLQFNQFKQRARGRTMRSFVHVRNQKDE